MYVCIDSSKDYKTSIPFVRFFLYLLSFPPYLHINILFSRIYLLLSFLHISCYYFLYYILSYFLPYPTFLRTPRHATHASLALLLLSPYPHVSYLHSIFIHFYTQSLPSLFDFRFSLIHFILTLILVHLLSPALLLRLCFFLF